jgi:hypothetical protein
MLAGVGSPMRSALLLAVVTNFTAFTLPFWL